jgi:hypothetical protein
MSKSILALLSLSILAAISGCCGKAPTGEKLGAPTVMSAITAEAVTPTSMLARQPSPTTTPTSPATPTPAPSSLPPSPSSATPTTPKVKATSLPEPTRPAVGTPFQGWGIDYCGPSLADCAALGATWSRSRISTLAEAQAALDLAQSLNMKLVLRLLPSEDWAWNGNQFDLTPLGEFEPIFDHPALLGFYGLHEPWERFDVDQLRLFYQQFQEVVAGHNVLLWQDLGYIHPTFTDGICDLCGVAVNPHKWDRAGNPAQDWERTTQKLDGARQYMASSSATLCAGLQVYGLDFSIGMRAPVRMPTPEEYMENVRLVVETYGVRCVTNYAYTHRSYDHVLGDADQAPLREAVHQMAERYFGP